MHRRWVMSMALALALAFGLSPGWLHAAAATPAPAARPASPARPSAPAACPGPALDIRPGAAGQWWVPAWAGESDADNRGQVSNLWLVRHGHGRQAGLWALGSGPSPAWGAALACQVQRRLGLPLVAVISPWARPELVLGVAGIQRWQPGAAHWAHAGVADAMAAQCPHCVDRLRQRLGPAAADLGDDPIRLPEHRLSGDHGRLGPFRWWRLQRAEGRWVTVWRLQHAPWWAAPGLLLADAAQDGAQGGAHAGVQDSPPDGREADLALLQHSLLQLAGLAQADGAAARFLGEQGPWQAADAPRRQAAYWAALRAAVRAAIERGDDEAAAAPPLPGWPAHWASHPWHGFNWQRAWRQLEPEVLAAPGR